MFQPNAVMPVRKSSFPSSYLLQNLIQPQFALPTAKRKNSISNINGIDHKALESNDYNAERRVSGKKSKKVQQLAEEVATLLVDEESIMTEIEKGQR